MIVRFEKINELSTHQVEFYSAYLGDESLTEFELFDEKSFPNHDEIIEILYATIDQIRVRGAYKRYFRDESGANAMPSVKESLKCLNNEDYGIRLYCIRLHDNLVVLLNGDIKTQQNPSECERVNKHFKNAVAIARILDRMVINKELNLQDINSLDDIEIDI